MRRTRIRCNEPEAIAENDMFETLLLTYAEERVIIIDEEISEKMIRTVLIPLLRLDGDEEERPIDIYLNTPGGDANVTLAICDAIDKLRCPTTIHILGTAYSGGLWIASAGRHNPNVRKIAYPNAEFMYHRLGGMMEGHLTQLEASYAWTESMQKRLNEYLLGHTALTESVLRKYKDKDWFFSAKEAFEYEIIDEVL